MIDSGIIGKIEKAKRYAQEPQRFVFTSFSVKIEGENNPHVVHFSESKWNCDCDFFQTHGLCTHTLSLSNYILKDMVPAPHPV